MEILGAKTIDADDDIASALRKMAHGSDRQLFVTSGKKFIGVVTLRSLMDARSLLQTKVGHIAFVPMRLSKSFDSDAAMEFMIQTGLDALPIIEGDAVVGQVNLDALLKDLNPQGTVADYMTADPVTITSDTPISKARSIMRNYGIHRLLVSDNGTKLDGMITASDIVRNVLVPQEKEKKGDLGTKKSPSYGFPVSTFMTKNPVTIGPNIKASDALKLMIDKDIRALPVIENGELVGILTKRTMARDAMPQTRRGAWVRISGADKLDYFTVSLIHKVVRDYVKKMARREKFDEIELVIKGKYEVKVALISAGKRLRGIEVNGWDAVAAVAEALRKLESGAKT